MNLRIRFLVRARPRVGRNVPCATSNVRLADGKAGKIGVSVLQGNAPHPARRVAPPSLPLPPSLTPLPRPTKWNAAQIAPFPSGRNGQRSEEGHEAGRGAIWRSILTTRRNLPLLNPPTEEGWDQNGARLLRRPLFRILLPQGIGLYTAGGYSGRLVVAGAGTGACAPA
jgi:hypothetical protein